MYLRLSREDGDKTESDSIANQRTLLEVYAADHPELCIVDEFVDDGYSGSNFERPAFQNLFRELEQGTINCVLVKDLSRFGRNYIEVGRYLERIFPVMRVRLIAVTDNYDSQSAWKTSDSIMVPMRNLLNDAYCRDISVKIKSQLAVKRKRGDFVGSFATYGYQKDPSNHTKLIVDELAGEKDVPMAVGHSLTFASKFELQNKSWSTPAVLTAAGCHVSIITDSSVIPQQYLPLCAGMAVKAGMDPFDALKAITINPAEHIGVADRVGSLEVGKDADLVITAGSPFEVLTEVKAVFIDGARIEQA